MLKPSHFTLHLKINLTKNEKSGVNYHIFCEHIGIFSSLFIMLQEFFMPSLTSSLVMQQSEQKFHFHIFSSVFKTDILLSWEWEMQRDRTYECKECQVHSLLFESPCGPKLLSCRIPMYQQTTCTHRNTHRNPHNLCVVFVLV